MTEVTTKIGAFNAAKRAVPVTFTGGGVIHKRDVNAVLDDKGKYDVAGTKVRVAEVARGVAAKIETGVITNPAAPEPEAGAA
ncbi:hypothetical protein [Sphingopyxis sp.]|uniref:hypothetical protein n=1 Tax=Sphingopyxis sp. TaxID=1908224 RepID=UPI0040352C89